MTIDISRIVSDRPIAVQFNSKDEAELFLEEMKRHYPKRVVDWNVAHYPLNYEEDGGVCYCPYLNTGLRGMTHGSRHHFENTKGYEVVEFQELTHSADISETDMPISVLLS